MRVNSRCCVGLPDIRSPENFIVAAIDWGSLRVERDAAAVWRARFETKEEYGEPGRGIEAMVAAIETLAELHRRSP